MGLPGPRHANATGDDNPDTTFVSFTGAVIDAPAW